MNFTLGNIPSVMVWTPLKPSYKFILPLFSFNNDGFLIKLPTNADVIKGKKSNLKFHGNTKVKYKYYITSILDLSAYV